MNRYVTEQLMTIDEAMRLSDPDAVPTPDPWRHQRNHWSWQTVSGAMDQIIDTDFFDSSDC